MEKNINIVDVIDITKEGLIFKDNSGTINTISFEECRKNWVAHVNKGGFIDWEKNSVHLTVQDSRCVGIRKMDENPPYIVLYSNDKLKIEMKPKYNKRLTNIQKNFFSLLYSLAEVTTFDMS